MFLAARLSGGEPLPLSQGRGAVLLEDFAAVEMAFQIEVTAALRGGIKMQQRSKP